MQKTLFQRLVTSGEYFVWLCGSAVSLALLLVVGLVGLIAVNGLMSFWPPRLVEMTLSDGSLVLGSLQSSETRPVPKIQLKRGNRDVYGEDFSWIEEASIKEQHVPKGVLAVERLEWGVFYGRAIRLLDKGKPVAANEEQVRLLAPKYLEESLRRRREMRRISKDDIGDINSAEESIRLELKSEGEQINASSRSTLENEQAELRKKYESAEIALDKLRAEETASIVFQTVDGKEKDIPFAQIVHLVYPNDLSVFGRSTTFLGNVWSFITEDPRESNTEGGVFPAIFGTVMAVLLMTLVVVPFGVIAAIYLREYAKQGKFVAIVRIAVNNLAGVPSIVFGVFGVGFFIYFLGGSIDKLFFAESLPSPTYGTGGILWASLTLALLTVPTVIVATEEGLASIPRHLREASYALGATKFETTWKVVLPSLAPSILTGMILAVARAAGEVAPLMITGVVKLAPSLPLDGSWPFLHVDRKFMHLGFHIYDVGFQSPNVEAARPMVYATTLLLLILVLLLNVFALVVRNRLKRRFVSSAV